MNPPTQNPRTPGCIDDKNILSVEEWWSDLHARGMIYFGALHHDKAYVRNVDHGTWGAK
jgi:hypothetical protein